MRKSPLDAYLAGMPATKASQVRRTLLRPQTVNGGEVEALYAHIEDLVSKGWRARLLRGSGVLFSPSRKSWLEMRGISSTALAYAQWLEKHWQLDDQATAPAGGPATGGTDA